MRLVQNQKNFRPLDKMLEKSAEKVDTMGMAKSPISTEESFRKPKEEPHHEKDDRSVHGSSDVPGSAGRLHFRRPQQPLWPGARRRQPRCHHRGDRRCADLRAGLIPYRRNTEGPAV